MLPNALLPLITIAGINLGLLLGGTVVTETVFSWPGVGRLIVQSVSQRDYPVIIAGVFVVCLIFVLVNLVVDMLYAMARSAREAVMSRAHRAITTLDRPRSARRCVVLLARGRAAAAGLRSLHPGSRRRACCRRSSGSMDGRLSVFGTDDLGRDVLSRMALGRPGFAFHWAFGGRRQHCDRRRCWA